MSSYWYIQYIMTGGITGSCTSSSTNVIFNPDTVREDISKSVPGRTKDDIVICFFKELTKRQFKIFTEKIEPLKDK